MEVRRKRPPPRFSVEAASSRKVGLGGDGTSFTVGRYAARGSRYWRALPGSFCLSFPAHFALRNSNFFLSSGNSISRVLYVGGHQEDFGTCSSDSPASPFLTSPASKSAKGTMSSPTLAFSRAFT